MELGEILKGLTPEDIEKIKLLSAIFGGGTQLNLKEITIEQGINEYEKFAEFNLAHKTVTLIKTANRRLLKFLPRNRIIYTIEKKDVESLFIKLSKTAPLGATNYIRVYRTMFNIFKEWNYTTTNPFEKLKLPKRQKEEPIVISEAQINKIIEVLKKMRKSIIGEMVRFAVESGLRLGEEVNLRWSDIDFKNGIITIGNKIFKTKSKKIRKIPFNEIMKEILTKNFNRQMKNGKIIREFVFSQNNGKSFKHDTISKSFKKAVREAGLPEEFHWHCLRSTAASNWVNKHVPIYTVQKLLGHANVSTTQIYAKVNLEELRDAVNRL